MQRLDGFKFDDVSGMREAGVDTEGVVRTAMIALMEGAMISGIFHGDLHGETCSCSPTGAPHCSTSASSGDSTTHAASPSCG